MSENVRATVERLGREHVGKSWWVDLAEALVAEFEPVVEERDVLAAAAAYSVDCCQSPHQCNACRTMFRAALDRGTP